MIQRADQDGGEFVYDPNHPMNVEDRANDPDDGIDYDEIIATTEADFRAGRYEVYESMEEFKKEFFRRTDEMIERARAKYRSTKRS